MKHIPIEETVQGMILAGDILSTTGQLLVAKGTALNGSVIKSLIRHGINRIPVQSEEDKMEPFSEDEILKAEEICRERVLGRFYEIPSDPMMKVLYETALRIEAMEYLRCRKKG
ncbi:MAG: hypothetical protein AB1480_02725 [Nitrospirota bacterium]